MKRYLGDKFRRMDYIMRSGPTDYEVVKFLLFQQFYYGNDRIFGRTNDIYVDIKGAGHVIESFYEDLINRFNLVKEGRYREFIEIFAEEVFPIDVEGVYSRFMKSMDAVPPSERNSQIITSLLYGEILMDMHRICFEDALDELRVTLMDRLGEKGSTAGAADAVTGELVEKKMDKLRYLFSFNDKNIGMLYNLSFLKMIAFKKGDMRVYKHTVKEMNKFKEIIIGMLLNEYR